MKVWAVSTLIVGVIAIPASAGIIYVDDDAGGASDGTNWTNAYVHLQDALAQADSAEGPVEIRVAQGVYQPDRGTNQVRGDRGATFGLIDGVALKGGYAGLGQVEPEARDPGKFNTVLHGDLQGNDAPAFENYGDNSQVVVTSVHNDSTAMLDGFIITGGLGWSGPGISCYDSNAVFADCTVIQNKSIGREGGWGGGMYISGGTPKLTHCSFEGNWALAQGGGIWCQSLSRPLLTGCVFRRNSAAGGGGLAAGQCHPVLRYCVFENNEAGYGAGLGSHYRSHVLLINCSFFGNRAPKGVSLYVGQESIATAKHCIFWNDVNEIMGVDSSHLDISYSNVRGSWPGRGNIDTDPWFAAPGHWIHVDDPNLPVDPNGPEAVWVKGDYHLKSEAGRWDPDTESWVFDDVTSPCIDAGDPNDPVLLEPPFNGAVTNLGAYGGTPEASKSPSDLVSMLKY